MVGGFVITPEYTDQVHYVFSRIVFALRLRFQRPLNSPSARGDSDTPVSHDCSIQQWLNGAKIVTGPLSAVITLMDAAGPAAGGDGRKGQIIVACRGPVDQRRQLFFLQVP